MKLTVFVLLATLSCATTGTGPTPTTTWKTCATDALKTQAEGILGQVATALSTGDYEAELAKLVLATSAAEVACAVQLAVSEFTRKAAASNDPLVKTELANGQAYLAAHAPAQ